MVSRKMRRRIVRRAFRKSGVSTMRANRPAPRYNKFIRASKYTRKKKASQNKKYLSKNVARFFRVPPSEITAVLRGVPMYVRLEKTGGTNLDSGMGQFNLIPLPVEGLMAQFTNLYPYSQTIQKVYGVSSYFKQYQYCVVFAMSITCQIWNHSSTNTMLVQMNPVRNLGDIWTGSYILDLFAYDGSKSFLLSPRGTPGDKKTVKVFLRTKDYIEQDISDFRFAKDGKNPEGSASAAKIPFNFCFNMVSCPLFDYGGSGTRNAMLADIKCKVKYFAKFYEIKPKNQF